MLISVPHSENGPFDGPTKVFVSLVVARFTQQEKIAALEDESALLTGKDNKKERAAKGTLGRLVQRVFSSRPGDCYPGVLPGLDDHMWETSMEDEVDR